jgi:N-acyl-D-aspartate/D-glutamate deacylase
MRHPLTMIASDGKLSQIGKNHPHPRSYGTFPRVLGYYVRERAVLDLEVAIKKMTSMPADLLGMKSRGRIAENSYADLVLFNPETIKDNSTFEDPHHYPSGIPYVIVNGIISIENGELTGNRSGKLLLSPTKK